MKILTVCPSGDSLYFTLKKQEVNEGQGSNKEVAYYDLPFFGGRGLLDCRRSVFGGTGGG